MVRTADSNNCAERLELAAAPGIPGMTDVLARNLAVLRDLGHLRKHEFPDDATNIRLPSDGKMRGHHSPCLDVLELRQINATQTFIEFGPNHHSPDSGVAIEVR